MSVPIAPNRIESDVAKVLENQLADLSNSRGLAKSAYDRWLLTGEKWAFRCRALCSNPNYLKVAEGAEDSN